jgi:pimeloyl-ACP methyl ester carboxylesterase
LIHGYGDTADGWRRVVPGLLPRHRVVALDVPPFGRSGQPDADHLLEFYKDFFPELLGMLEIDSATVIGHSLGGAIALHVALARPDLVDRLGLVAPAGLGSAPPWWWHLLTGYDSVYRRALSIPNPLTPLLIRQGMKRFLDWRLFHDPTKLHDDIQHLVQMHGTATDLQRLLKAGRCCIESYTGRLLEDSRTLDIPMWMVWGRHDGLVPSEHALAFGQAHRDA